MATTYSALLGVSGGDRGTPSEPSLSDVLSFVSMFNGSGVLASVVRNRFRRASVDHVMGLISSLHMRGLVTLEDTGAVRGGLPVVRVRVAVDDAPQRSVQVRALRDKITDALRKSPAPLSVLVNRLRPAKKEAILAELRSMHRDMLIWGHPPGKFLYPARPGKRARKNSKMVFELR